MNALNMVVAHCTSVGCTGIRGCFAVIFADILDILLIANVPFGRYFFLAKSNQKPPLWRSSGPSLIFLSRKALCGTTPAFFAAAKNTDQTVPQFRLGIGGNVRAGLRIKGYLTISINYISKISVADKVIAFPFAFA